MWGGGTTYRNVVQQERNNGTRWTTNTRIDISGIGHQRSFHHACFFRSWKILTTIRRFWKPNPCGTLDELDSIVLATTEASWIHVWLKGLNTAAWSLAMQLDYIFPPIRVVV